MAASKFGATQRLYAVAVLCLAAVGVALFSQYMFDMRPCPWCILQRLLFTLIAVLCIVAAWLRGGPRVALGGISVLLAACGIAAALYQNLVAAKSSSCNLTFADKIITGIGVDKLLPSVFQVTGSCAEAAVSILGVPYEFWSLAVFGVAGLLVLSALRAR
jgi:protein dithiol:quinone oxidoreductase